MALNSSDKKLTKVVNMVKYKKVDGSFTLLTNRLTWNPTAGDAKKFQCLYSEIKVQRISPESSSKIQLQIVLHDDSSYNFHFVHAKGRSAQLKDRNEMKDLLAELIPAHRLKANKDLEEKNKIFKEKPELYQLYKDLVVSGIITADEFWENQKSNKKPTNEVDKQEVGIASGLLAELKPDMHGCNELRFNLTADSIDAIFKMYPAVKKKYIGTVPNEMTEKEFWTEFFKSQHFHRDRVPKSSSKDMFGDLAKKDEQELMKQISESFYDPLIDFTSASPNTEDGYGTVSKERQSANESLIKQFNHQSLMVLQNVRKRSSVEKNMTNEFKKKRIREAVGFEELEKRETHTAPPLNILDMDKFAHNPSTETNGHMNGAASSDHQKNLLNFKQNITAWTPKLSQVLSADIARAVVAEISPGGKLMTSSAKSNIETTAQDLQEEMQRNYISLAELLRHFWSCFPIKTPQLEEKVRRMASSLEKYRDTKLANFRCMQPSHCNQLSDHLADMIDTALKKFTSWEERRSGTKAQKC